MKPWGLCRLVDSRRALSRRQVDIESLFGLNGLGTPIAGRIELHCVRCMLDTAGNACAGLLRGKVGVGL